MQSGNPSQLRISGRAGSYIGASEHTKSSNFRGRGKASYQGGYQGKIRYTRVYTSVKVGFQSKINQNSIGNLHTLVWKIRLPTQAPGFALVNALVKHRSVTRAKCALPVEKRGCYQGKYRCKCWFWAPQSAHGKNLESRKKHMLVGKITPRIVYIIELFDRFLDFSGMSGKNPPKLN